MTTGIDLAADYVARQGAVAQRFGELGIDGALITKPASRHYLTGFSADDDGTVVVAGLFLGPNGATLMTSSTNAGWAKEEAVSTPVEVWVRPWEPAAARKIRSLGWRRVGIEPDALSLKCYRALTEALGPEVELIDLGPVVDDARAIKTPAEIELITRAVQITDEAFVAATADLAVGTTEAQLAWRIEQEMRRLGSDQTGFGIIVAAGPHGAAPHHAPTDYAIAEGEPIVIDMGAQVKGYKADLTRTIWLGEAPDRLREVVAIVSAANDAARAASKPGTPGREVHEAAAAVIAAAGYGDAFLHGVGHGVGLEIHEAPSAGPISTDILQVGHTLTIEPGIYLEGWGGVRIEDFGVIEADGYRTLSAAPKQMGT